MTDYKRNIILAYCYFSVMVVTFFLLFILTFDVFSRAVIGWVGLFASTFAIMLDFITKKDKEELTGWRKTIDVLGTFCYFIIFIQSLGKVVGN